MNRATFFGAAMRGACQSACASAFVFACSAASAAQQADSALPTAPGAPPGVYAPASAAPLATPPSATSSILSNLSLSWSGYFEALAILCFALALLWAVLWLVKRHSKGGFFGNSPNMRVESRLALAPKKWILVVRCLDRRLVLGLTDDNISFLTEVSVDEAPAGKAAAGKSPAASVGKAGQSRSQATPEGPVAGMGTAPGGEAGNNGTTADQLFASLLRDSKEDASSAK